MHPYSLTFFYLMFVFILLNALLIKVVHSKWMVYFFFAATVLYLYFAYPSHYLKFISAFVFYSVLIKSASIFKNVTRLLFVLPALIPLFVFKFVDLFPALGVANNLMSFIGLSYVSFRVIQILLDTQVSAPQNYLGIFVFLFNPITLLAGPIDRYYRFEENLKNIQQEINKKNFLQGWYYLCFGVLQKFILAFFWDKYVMNNFNSQSHLWIDILGTAYSYTVYLVLDFSGYSLMAVGLSYMMGFKLPMNFDRPWLTQNPSDLWRRFHITLGSFLNDYFFKPIYMWLARHSYFKSHRLLAQNISLLLTFLLMGAWNGLKWNYIASGFMFGLSSVVYNTYQSKFKKQRHFLLNEKMLFAYRVFFINYIVFALYLFSGKLPV